MSKTKSKQKNKQKALQDLRKGITTPMNTGGYWSDDDRIMLECLYNLGIDISEIALFLKRSENGVVEQLKARKLMPPAKYSHPRKPKEAKCICNKCGLRGGCEYYTPNPKED